MAETEQAPTELEKQNEDPSEGDTVNVENNNIIIDETVGEEEEIDIPKYELEDVTLESNTQSSILKTEQFEFIDLLVDVPLEDFPDMLFRMENNYPLGIHAHEHVKALLRWKKLNPNLEMAILAPDGDYKQGIIFYSVYEGSFNGSVYCHDNEETIALQNALSQTARVPLYGKNMSRLTSMTLLSYESIKPHIPKRKWCTSEDVVLWLPWYCARELKVNLPSDVEIRELQLEHADLINEEWPHKYSGSVELIAEMITVNICLGLFREECLLSWVMCWIHGGIGMMQTIESEKRKGYSRAVIEAITKEMGRKLIDVHLNIARGKKNHQKFFKALGFRFAFKSYNSEIKKQQDKKEVSKINPIKSETSFRNKTKIK